MNGTMDVRQGKDIYEHDDNDDMIYTWIRYLIFAFVFPDLFIMCDIGGLVAILPRVFFFFFRF